MPAMSILADCNRIEVINYEGEGLVSRGIAYSVLKCRQRLGGVRSLGMILVISLPLLVWGNR